MEKRLLLAFILSAVIFMVWSVVFPPPTKTPMKPGVIPATPESASPMVSPVPEGSSATEPDTEESGDALPVTEEVGRATAAPGDSAVELDNGLVHLIVGGRGGAVTSLVLDRYDDDEGRPLELVQDVDLPLRALPLQLVGAEGPDTRVYELEKDGQSLRARYSDGRSVEIVKTISLSEGSYAIGIHVEVRGTNPYPWVAVGTGMRNIGETEKENRFATWGDAVILAGDKLEKLRRKKVKEVVERSGEGLFFAGFQDTYFLDVIRDSGSIGAVRIVPLKVPEKVFPGPEEGTSKAKKKKKKRRPFISVSSIRSPWSSSKCFVGSNNMWGIGAWRSSS